MINYLSFSHKLTNHNIPRKKCDEVVTQKWYGFKFYHFSLLYILEFLNFLLDLNSPPPPPSLKENVNLMNQIELNRIYEVYTEKCEILYGT